MKKLLPLLFLPFAAFASTNQFDKIYFFGDSLSDTGNLYRYLGHFLPKSPPYYKGRFSNGPVWSEIVFKDYFRKGDVKDFNYAVGGAAAVLSVNAPLPFTLATEVDDYIYLHGEKDKSKNLYVVWIGGNNYLKGPTDVEAITTKVVDAIDYSIENLIKHGASKFLVANLPDMGSVPEGRENGKEQLLSQLSKRHNEKLASKMDVLRKKYPEVTFVFFDVQQKFDDFYRHPEKYNIHHVNTACFSGGYTARPSTLKLKNYLQKEMTSAGYPMLEAQQQAFLQSPVLKEALVVAKHFKGRVNTPDCSDYLFWDHIHPTTTMHQYVAKFIEEALNKAGLKAIKA